MPFKCSELVLSVDSVLIVGVYGERRWNNGASRTATTLELVVQPASKDSHARNQAVAAGFGIATLLDINIRYKVLYCTVPDT